MGFPTPRRRVSVTTPRCLNPPSFGFGFPPKPLPPCAPLATPPGPSPHLRYFGLCTHKMNNRNALYRKRGLRYTWWAARFSALRFHDSGSRCSFMFPFGWEVGWNPRICDLHWLLFNPISPHCLSLTAHYRNAWLSHLLAFVEPFPLWSSPWYAVVRNKKSRIAASLNGTTSTHPDFFFSPPCLPLFLQVGKGDPCHPPRATLGNFFASLNVDVSSRRVAPATAVDPSFFPFRTICPMSEPSFTVRKHQRRLPR